MFFKVVKIPYHEQDPKYNIYSTSSKLPNSKLRYTTNIVLYNAFRACNTGTDHA